VNPAPADRLLPVASSRETLRLAARLARTRRGALAAAALAFAAAAIAGVAPPWLLGGLVDGARSGDTHAVAAAAAGIAVAAVFGGVSTAASAALLARGCEPALARLREDVLERAVHLESAWSDGLAVGDLLSRVGDDVRTVTRSLAEAVPLLISSVLAVAFTAGGMLVLDWRLALAGALAVPLYGYAARWYLPRTAPIYRAQRLAEGERAEALVAGVHGAATLRALSLDEAQLERAVRTSGRAAQLQVAAFAVFTRFFTRNNLAEFVGLAGVLVTGFFLVEGTEATVGEVTAAALLFHRLFNPITSLLLVLDEVQSAGASLTRLAGVALLPEPRPAAVPAVPDGGPAGAGLQLREVTHAYRSGEPVLTGVSLVVRPGERVAVVGATGAGKSTLGGIAAGVLRPSSGSVTVGGVPAGSLDRRQLRRRVVLVSQEVHVFAGTVRDNLTLARAGATDEELVSALRTAGAWSWVAALPEGLDTVVGQEGSSLTPARAQHLALVRVLLADPAVVVLDEATAETGSAGARELDRAAAAVAQGRAVLTIAHRLTQARAADRVVVLHAGRVVEEGSHDELVAAGGPYARLWSAWSAV
jgi:ATP-binding cassette subfamily C protein